MGFEHARPMRIGIVAPPWFEVPPRGYGGIEAVVGPLVDQLTLLGHEVVLVGAGASGTHAALFAPSYSVAPSSLLGTPVPEMLHAAFAAETFAREGVDIVHDHSLAGPLLALGRGVPTVVTMHGEVTGDLGRYYELLGSAVHLVAISAAQRRLNPRLNWVATVPNAIDVEDFPFRPHKDGYLLWIGRLCAQKAPDIAIAAARMAGRRIVLAGKFSEPAERQYFEQEVRPLLGSDAVFVGEADRNTKRELFAGASALLFPIQWEEPFGMVMLEAMACGTPVVALNRGAVPDVVVDGRTGFITEDLLSFVSALTKVDGLDPAAMRAHVEENFSLQAMAARYEQVYRAVLEQAIP